jgi:hypothetical protein
MKTKPKRILSKNRRMGVITKPNLPPDIDAS